MRGSWYGLVLLLAGLLLVSCSGVEQVGTLEKIAPEDAGFSSPALREFEQHLAESGSAALIASSSATFVKR